MNIPQINKWFAINCWAEKDGRQQEEKAAYDTRFNQFRLRLKYKTNLHIVRQLQQHILSQGRRRIIREPKAKKLRGDATAKKYFLVCLCSLVDESRESKRCSAKPF